MVCPPLPCYSYLIRSSGRIYYFTGGMGTYNTHAMVCSERSELVVLFLKKSDLTVGDHSEFIADNPGFVEQNNSMDFLSDNGSESYNLCHCETIVSSRFSEDLM